MLDDSHSSHFSSFPHSSKNNFTSKQPHPHVWPGSIWRIIANVTRKRENKGSPCQLSHKNRSGSPTASGLAGHHSRNLFVVRWLIATQEIHVALRVEASPARAARHLRVLRRQQGAPLVAVVLRPAGEDDAAGRHVHTHGKGFGGQQDLPASSIPRHKTTNSQNIHK